MADQKDAVSAVLGPPFALKRRHEEIAERRLVGSRMMDPFHRPPVAAQPVLHQVADTIDPLGDVRAAVDVDQPFEVAQIGGIAALGFTSDLNEVGRGRSRGLGH